MLLVDPYAIYARARSHWAAQAYPHFVTYTVQISGANGTRRIVNTYASFDDTQTNAITVRATSEEEASRPPVPRGVNVDAKVTIGWALHPHLGAAPSVNGNGDVNVTKTMPVSSREQADLLGVPVLSPAYAFGLAPQTATVNQSNPAPPTPTGLKTIALVTASQRGDYNVRFAGTQTIDGAPCDVLELTPRGDPTLLRLRKLWIDEQTFATRQALLQGNFTAGPGPRLPWLVHFAQHDNLTYIEEEDALTPVHYLGKTYTNVSVRFSDVTASGPPDVTWRISMFRTSGDILREP